MFKKHLTACVLLFMAILCGCGLSEYERRREGRITALKTGSVFNILSSAIDIPGTSLSIRIPKEFNSTPITEGIMLDGKTIDARRVKPALIEMPDQKATYEGFIEDANKGKQPYYLYVAVSTGPNRVNFPRLLQAELSAKFNNTTQLGPMQAPTPEGRSVEWQQCRGTGNQIFFYVLPSGDGQFTTMPGAMEILFREENDKLITLAWRMPSSIEGTIDFKSWIKLTAGCVNVE